MGEYAQPAREFAKSTAVFGPVFAKLPAMWFGVVAAIGVNDVCC